MQTRWCSPRLVYSTSTCMVLGRRVVTLHNIATAPRLRDPKNVGGRTSLSVFQVCFADRRTPPNLLHSNRWYYAGTATARPEKQFRNIQKVHLDRLYNHIVIVIEVTGLFDCLFPFTARCDVIVCECLSLPTRLCSALTLVSVGDGSEDWSESDARVWLLKSCVG